MTASSQTVPQIPLPPIDLAGWLSLSAAHPGLPFGQHWLPSPEPSLSPGTGWVFCDATNVYFFASLQDEDFVHRGKQYNDYLFDLGDVLEVFIQAEGTDPYYELHCDPAGLSYQALFPSLADFAARRGKFDLEEMLAPYKLAQPVAQTKAWKLPDSKRWCGLITLPLATLGNPAAARIAFCRYDAFDGNKPSVLSSTAPLQKLDFHRPTDWPVFTLSQDAKSLKK